MGRVYRVFILVLLLFTTTLLLLGRDEVLKNVNSFSRRSRFRSITVVWLRCLRLISPLELLSPSNLITHFGFGVELDKMQIFEISPKSGFSQQHQLLPTKLRSGGKYVHSSGGSPRKKISWWYFSVGSTKAAQQ